MTPTTEIRFAYSKGFTLIELMIVVAIIAIISSIAYPNYSQFVTRGRLTDGQKILASYALAQERFFQNNNRYNTALNGTTCGISTSGSNYTSSDFTLSCSAANTSYTATLTGKTGGKVSGYVYTINDSGTRQTTQFKGVSKSGVNCWTTSETGSC